jgi:hypothetical protein
MTGFLIRTITVAAVARAVSAAAVAAGVWASGGAALGPSFGVTSLQGFDVIRDPSLNDSIRPRGSCSDAVIGTLRAYWS